MRRTFAYLLAAVATITAGSARAAIVCHDTTNNIDVASPIYITGSTALEPLIKNVGKALANGANPNVLVYLKDGSCAGVTRLAGDGTIALGKVMAYIPATYDLAANATPPTCTITATAGETAGVVGDLVLSDVDASLCPAPNTFTGVTDFSGPVNDMVFVVPTTSTQKAISAEMAYLILGLGDLGMVMPFIDPLYYFIRAADSGTRAMIAANISTGSHAWKGVSADSSTGKSFGSGDVLNKVAAQAALNPEKTLGILGSDFWDTANNRASVKALAYRAFHQHFAYWPDSTLTSRDKKNVREGRYGIWGYVHMLAKTTNSVPTSTGAKTFIDLVTGAATLTGVDVQDVITDAHLTPVCAMKVKHTIEAGPMSAYTPDAPCGCSFEKRATGAEPTGCMACTTTCPGTQACRKGYCEAK